MVGDDCDHYPQLHSASRAVAAKRRSSGGASLLVKAVGAAWRGWPQIRTSSKIISRKTTNASEVFSLLERSTAPSQALSVKSANFTRRRRIADAAIFLRSGDACLDQVAPLLEMRLETITHDDTMVGDFKAKVAEHAATGRTPILHERGHALGSPRASAGVAE